MGPYLTFLYFDFEGTRGIYFRMGFRLMDLLDNLYQISSRDTNTALVNLSRRYLNDKD